MIAAQIKNVSAVISALAQGKNPTPTELGASIKLATPSKSKEWTDLATTIVTLYGGVWPSINGNPALVLKILGDVADGLNDAASGFVPTPPQASYARNAMIDFAILGRHAAKRP